MDLDSDLIWARVTITVADIELPFFNLAVVRWEKHQPSFAALS